MGKIGRVQGFRTIERSIESQALPLSPQQVIHSPEQVTAKEQLKVGSSYAVCRKDSKTGAVNVVMVCKLIAVDKPQKNWIQIEPPAGYWGSSEEDMKSRGAHLLSVALEDRGILPYNTDPKLQKWNTTTWLERR